MKKIILILLFFKFYKKLADQRTALQTAHTPTTLSIRAGFLPSRLQERKEGRKERMDG